MKPPILLPALLGVIGFLASPTQARAQCGHTAFAPAFGMAYYSGHHRCCCQRDTCDNPFRPGRLAGYLGVMGLVDRQQLPYAGADAEVYYWLLPRWSSGLRGTLTGQMPAGRTAEAYAGIGDPRLALYSLTWSNQVLLTDGPRWRVAAQVGAGLGVAELYDKDRQVPVKGDCHCTQAEKMATATAPVTEVGLAATYKLKGDAPWLTVRGGYRQWTGAIPFGTLNQFSTYVLSIGISVPDAPGRR